MSLTQTYYLAHTARAKLSKEASRGDHNLRRLVGHANLLDGLMLDLVEAERSQESLFTTTTPAKSSHVQWAPEPSRTHPTITEDYEEEEEESDSEYDGEEEDDEPILSSAKTISVTISEYDDEDDQATDDEEDDYDSLALVRTSSRSSPPELFHDSDEDSDEDSLPPSPPTPEMPVFPPISNKKTQESIQNAFEEEGFYLPTRTAVAVC